MKGRKRKPTALKVASGTAEHNPQRMNPNEPQPPIGAPPKPEFVDPVASQAWDDCCRWLADCQLLTVVEAGLIRAYAENWADYSRLRKAWLRDGKYSPGYRHTKDSNLKLLAEMGLTPSSRSRVSKITEAPQTDAAEAFFKTG